MKDNSPKIQKVSMVSENIENENLQKLREVFPNFVKDGVIDFDALQSFLKKDGVLAEGEKYGLSWAGKSDAFKAIRTPATGTLTPQEDESKNWDKTGNIFIEGDNLEVLKLLQKNYRGKIKMCYIDPPYNTGKDFVYKDNFTKGVSDYYEQTGQTKDGIKLTTNFESNGRYHSDWLTMMYPRLFLARNLLKEDGVIFISIDDHEVANLRLIMDEIFGEENFIGTITWEKRTKAQNTETSKEQFQSKTEYIIVYKKSVEKIKFNLEVSGEKSYDLKDKNGIYRLKVVEEMSAFGMRSRQTMIYPIMGIMPKTGNQWKVGKDSVKIFEERGDIEIIEGKPYFRMRPSDEDVEKFIPFWSHFFDKNTYGTAETGKAELGDLLEKNNHGFETVKPLNLILKLISHTTDVDDIVLDFFAGSGTTAHAVMEQNVKDTGNRKFICVQIPEVLNPDKKEDKEMYNFLQLINRPTNIAEFCKERILRAGRNIEDKIDSEMSNRQMTVNSGMADGDELEIKKVPDIGFKAFSLSSSNYRKWNTLTVEDDEKALLQQAKLFTEKPLVDKYDKQSVIYEILLKEGFDLNATVIEEIKKKEIPLYIVTDSEKKMVITFVDKLTKEQFDSLEIQKDYTFVCFDSALDDTIKVNIMRNLTVKTI
ncbi:MAG: site-specific DNA-methyltransferase [Candidatus Nomurabacteria bacterium]|nr:site-specific DNA-methyltransferase [Candidatus Nomurabacteria bacterium]